MGLGCLTMIIPHILPNCIICLSFLIGLTPHCRAHVLLFWIFTLFALWKDSICENVSDCNCRWVSLNFLLFSISFSFLLPTFTSGSFFTFLGSFCVTTLSWLGGFAFIFSILSRRLLLLFLFFLLFGGASLIGVTPLGNIFLLDWLLNGHL